MKTAVIVFGRFNPPTKGHQELIGSYAIPYAKKHNTECVLFVTHTEDKDNPLTYKEKVSIIRKCFPDLRIGNERVHTLYDALNTMSKNYKDIHIVCGKDRGKEFTAMTKDWMKNHPGINVNVKPTPRDEQSVSGKLLRKAAIEGDSTAVKKLSMKTANPDALIHIIQKRLQPLNEEHMPYKRFSEWISEEKDDAFTPLDTPGQDEAPKPSKKKPKDEPTDLPDTDENPPENDDQTDTDTDTETMTEPTSSPAPKPAKPLPADATEDDGRVPADTPKNQSKLIIHPNIRVKYKMREKAKNLVNNGKSDVLNKNSRIGAQHYI